MNEKKELYYEEGINEQLPETVPASMIRACVSRGKKW